MYRGFRLETVGEFCNRIRKKFPTAMLYMKSEAPDADVLKKSPQVIQIQTLVVEKEQVGTSAVDVSSRALNGLIAVGVHAVLYRASRTSANWRLKTNARPISSRMSVTVALCRPKSRLVTFD